MADTQGNGAPSPGGQYSGPRAVDPAPPDTHRQDPDYITRTRFLSGVAVAGGAVLTAAILVPLVGFAVADTVKDEEWRWVDAGPLSDFAPGETASLAISGPNPEADRRVFVRYKDNQIIAIWNRCAHLGCPVQYIQAGDNYICPCHGGAYDSLGRTTAGPPPRPLDRFDVKVVADGEDVGRPGDVPGSWRVPRNAPDGARVLIGKAFSIDVDQNPYRLHGPGEEVDGVLANLYPF
ncbi:MAG TPA: Rieske (2Fe-2S) protein [Miltoncostaeaceae bacterium]|nr:Rieske (2Fe-2S) protein [Miltoncostaeaceae bacterium]